MSTRRAAADCALFMSGNPKNFIFILPLCSGSRLSDNHIMICFFFLLFCSLACGSDTYNDLRFHLRETVMEAFSDALQDGSDLYQNGIAESDQKIMLLGERIFEKDVSNFCGALANQQFSHIPMVFRDGVHFKPTKSLPVPISNMTLDIPTRWFRDPLHKSPLIYVCYEGETFLKMLQIDKFPMDFQPNETFQTIQISSSHYNERCRIREILILLDDYWNKRNLLPRGLDARVLLETSHVVPRVVFTRECVPELGLDQQCCLWKFHFLNTHGIRQEFHRCFGAIPTVAVKSNQIPEKLAELLTRGMMTRRFLSPPSRVCRAIEFRPMVVGRDGITMTMNRLDAVKCGAFY